MLSNLHCVVLIAGAALGLPREILPGALAPQAACSGLCGVSRLRGGTDERVNATSGGETTMIYNLP
jgi:hypothetical protein